MDARLPWRNREGDSSHPNRTPTAPVAKISAALGHVPECEESPEESMKPTSFTDSRDRAREFVHAWLVADCRLTTEGWRLRERSLDALAERMAEVLSGHSMRPAVPSQNSEARQRLRDGLVTIGTPRKASRQALNEPDLRAPECPAYTKCLDHVVDQGWENWTCRGCDGPGVRDARSESHRKHHRRKK
jgi:hypothetical protein